MLAILPSSPNKTMLSVLLHDTGDVSFLCKRQKSKQVVEMKGNSFKGAVLQPACAGVCIHFRGSRNDTLMSSKVVMVCRLFP